MEGKVCDRDWSDRDRDRDWYWRDKDRNYEWYLYPHDRVKGKESSFIDLDKFKTQGVLPCILIHVDGPNKMVRDLKSDFSQLNKMVISHSAFINQLKNQVGQISAQLDERQIMDWLATWLLIIIMMLTS